MNRSVRIIGNVRKDSRAIWAMRSRAVVYETCLEVTQKHHLHRSSTFKQRSQSQPSGAPVTR